MHNKRKALAVGQRRAVPVRANFQQLRAASMGRAAGLVSLGALT